LTINDIRIFILCCRGAPMAVTRSKIGKGNSGKGEARLRRWYQDFFAMKALPT